MQREIAATIKNQRWQVVDWKSGIKPITTKWIYKIKRGHDGKAIKFKARTVVRGCQQTEGVDYDDIFALVVRWSTIRLFLALAAMRGWSLRQMDIMTAFLNGLIREEVYIEIPEGFPKAGTPKKIGKVNRALYGLKQSPKAWYELIDAWLVGQGLCRSEADTNLYYSIQSGKLVWSSNLRRGLRR